MQELYAAQNQESSDLAKRPKAQRWIKRDVVFTASMDNSRNGVLGGPNPADSDLRVVPFGVLPATKRELSLWLRLYIQMSQQRRRRHK
jgi:hypothetical protein